VKNLEGITKNFLKFTGLLFARYAFANVLPRHPTLYQDHDDVRFSLAPVSLITL